MDCRVVALLLALIVCMAGQCSSSVITVGSAAAGAVAGGVVGAAAPWVALARVAYGPWGAGPGPLGGGPGPIGAGAGMPVGPPSAGAAGYGYPGGYGRVRRSVYY